jgi:DNA replication and repair protein RecF
LCNFRIFEEATFSFSPTANCIIGENARGKTTILEAIYLLATGRSFRTNQITDLIQRGKEYFRIVARFSKHGVEHILKLYVDREKKQIFYNRSQYSTLISLLGILHSAAAIPEDIDLIKGPPILRRQYLDLLIATADPFYVHHLHRFHRALKHRNVLLRRKEMSASESFEMEMARSSRYIMGKRKEVICDLSGMAEAYYQSISKKEERFQIHLRSHCFALEDNEEAYKNFYKENRKRDLDYGYTYAGPHKDDLILSLAGEDARSFGSEGEMRLLALCLRLSEWKRLYAVTGIKPLFLIDEVGLGFDENKKKKLSHTFEQLGQFHVTTTDEEYPEMNRDAYVIALG